MPRGDPGRRSMQYLENKKILVTGCCGTVGSQLLRALLASGQYNPAQVIGIDNNETELFFQEQQYLDDPRARFFLADVRDQRELALRMDGADIVFHTAAYKHVVMCERSPMEAVQTNILGVENVIRAANETQVGKVIFTSSDKAVNPTNVMGTSKLMGERLMTAANSNRRNGGPIFASTRFGNVLGSNGSVIPIFRRQIENGGPVTITDEAMTRFVMSIEESVRLVIESAALARGGEVFITKMPVIRIIDLAHVMIDALADGFGHDPRSIELQFIGSKPGEKLYEELMSDEETRRAVELPRYFAVLPAFRGLYANIRYDFPELVSEQVTNPYVSSNETPLSRGELAEFLVRNRLLNDLSDTQRIRIDRRYWPGEKQ